ncbi:MAG TPA: asparagine synthase (glutamine-hydrolyzing) [Polyangia bacterium]|jgi:asparagine synthase (glutamine-hydrolysing)
MCGIAGALVPGGRPPALAPALARLAHRGPDDEGSYADGPVAIGMRRLSIIDLAGGHQPLTNEDGTVVVVCNGEIYNYLELTRELAGRGHRLRTASDVEVLAHLYEDEGPDLCRRLRGMFAFALWDARAQRLVLGRDRFGKKPLYYAQPGAGAVLFASELKALRPLMTAAGMAVTVSDQSVYDYLSLAVVPQPATIYEGALALPPAHVLVAERGGTRITRYWDLDYRVKQRGSYGEALERTRALVGEAVRLRLRSDVPLGIFLSGGVDSSVVAYEAARAVGGLQSFTVSTGDPALDEAAVAANTARALGIANEVLPLAVAPLDEVQRVVRHYDQPFADSSAIPSLAISRLAREHVTVVLNGDGGDEVFGGYRRYLAARLGGRVPAAAGALAGGVWRALLRGAGGERRSAAGFGSRFLRGLGQRPGARYLTWTMDALLEADKRAFWRRGPQRPTEAWLEAMMPPGLSALDTQLFMDVNVILPSDLLVKMDMATMAASLEGRSPLLDHVVAEHAAAQPDGHRLHGLTLKALLRDAYAGRLPDAVVRGAKRGFEIPLAAWLRGDLRPLIADTLAAPSARVRDYLDGAFVDRLLAGEVLPERNWATLVYLLLILELWLREARA